MTIQRYSMRQYHDDPPEMVEDSNGDYVLYADAVQPRTDSDRLDWFQRQHTLHGGVECSYVVDGYQVQRMRDSWEIGKPFHGQTLRDAIAAAMDAERK